MNMCILIVMNIYITEANEAYLRRVQGSMSGYINGLIEMDRAEAQTVRKHVVDEGRKLGKLPLNTGGGIAEPFDPDAFTALGINLARVAEQTRDAGGVIKNAPATPTRGSNGLCKVHGTPLDDRGKCLVKGCKHGGA